jgi:hypothetical protein
MYELPDFLSPVNFRATPPCTSVRSFQSSVDNRTLCGFNYTVHELKMNITLGRAHPGKQALEVPAKRLARGKLAMTSLIKVKSYEGAGGGNGFSATASYAAIPVAGRTKVTDGR